MVWDFAESNTISETGGSYLNTIDQISRFLHISGIYFAVASQQDAQNQQLSLNKIVSTDPPYYDNIGYADLSDFFYVWMRRTLRIIYPALFSTLAVPKAEELVATPYRHGGKDAAEHFFLDGMTQAMAQIATQSHPAFPVTIYYAFKQSDSGADGTTNTGWDTFLEAVIRAGFAINGTWPQRTEMANRMIGSGTNALASSIVLVCRQRDPQAPTATRSDFVRQLRSELPGALRDLQASNIAPVDLAQAAIGPGMGIYTRYAQVIDNQGEVVAVRAALVLINQVLDEVLAEQEGDFDADSRWAITWFEQHGFAAGDFGEADVLARAKNTGVDGLARAGIVDAARGKVRLLEPSELPADWDPRADGRLTAWESVHHLIRALNTGGEQAAATLIGQLGSVAEVARELSYRLYTICERKKRAREAIEYNALVQNFGEMRRIAQQQQTTQSQRTEQQASLF